MTTLHELEIINTNLGGYMAERSRIRFNPDTKEIEVEGSESFVKTYFGKLQAMISGDAEKTVPEKKEPKAAKAPKRKPVNKKRQSKKASKVITGTKRGDLSKAVLFLIQSSAEGIATAELKEKTGMKDRQIWPIISSAKKKGKIKQVKRGVYVRA